MSNYTCPFLNRECIKDKCMMWDENEEICIIFYGLHEMKDILTEMLKTVYD